MRIRRRFGEKAERRQLIFAVGEVERRLAVALDLWLVLARVLDDARTRPRRERLGHRGKRAAAQRRGLGLDAVEIVSVVGHEIVKVVFVGIAGPPQRNTSERAAERAQGAARGVTEIGQALQSDAGGLERQRQPHGPENQRHDERDPAAIGGRDLAGEIGDQRPQNAARARAQCADRGKHAHGRRQEQRAQNEGREPRRQPMHPRPHQHMPAPGDQRQNQSQHGHADPLQHEVGRVGAGPAQPVGRCPGGGIVEAGIGGIVGRNRHQRAHCEN